MALPPGVLSKSNTVDANLVNQKENVEQRTETVRSGMGKMASDNSVLKAAIKEEQVLVSDPKSDIAKGSIGFNAVSYDEKISPMQWFLVMLLYAIPIVNIVYVAYLLIKCEDEQKKNWAKGAAIMLVILYVINIITFIILKNISLAQLFDLYIQYKG